MRVCAHLTTPPGKKKEVLAVHSWKCITPEGALQKSQSSRWIRRFVNKTLDELEVAGYLQEGQTSHTLVCPKKGDRIQEYGVEDSHRSLTYEILEMNYARDDVGGFWACLKVKKLP